jgi:hypothetical protein
MRRVVLSVLALLVATGAAAQQTTGDIQGRVLASGAQPLPDVQVTVTSPSLQGNRRTLSDARGRFIVPSLPTGSYSVELRRIGYGPLRFQDVPVRLGITTSLGDVPLEAQAVEIPAVVVSGAKPVIDPVSAASGATLDSSQFLSLPSDRSFRSLIAYVPQANVSFYGDGVNVGGSTGLENAFFVDGMDVTVGAGTSVDLPFNFVREIQVITGGYEAEYGRALSAVVNVVTPSGSNQFHGQVLGFYTGDRLRTAPRVGIYEADVANFSQYDVGVSLSGPLRRDRLWYSVAYNPTFARRRESTGLLPARWDGEVHHLFAGKLTWSARPGTDVALTLLGDPSHRDGIEPVLPLTADSLAALSKYSTGSETVALAVRHQIGRGVELKFAVSRLRRTDEWYPRSGSTDFRSNVRLDDYTTNASSGGIAGYNNFRETRTALRTAVTVRGTGHTIKLGAEYEANAYVGSTQGGVVVRSADSVYEWFNGYNVDDVRNRVPTLYAQDSWEVTPRLRISAGLRWESQRISGEGPARVVPSELAPRLGVVFQPGEPGTARLFASAGRFYEQVPPLSAQWWNGVGYSQDRVFPQNPLIDSTHADTLNHAYTPVIANPDLLGQSYDQFGIGYERRLGSSYKLGVRGTYRVLRWIIDDGILPGETFFRMGNPGRGVLAAMPRARQRYTALELTLERAAPGPLYLFASYVLSRNVGNYTGLYSTDNGVALANSGSTYDVADAMTNAYGLLPNDRMHVVKAAASYRINPQVTLGGFLTIASGTPLSEGGQSAYGNYWTFVSPRGSVGRTPAIWSLDLHGAFDVPVAQTQRVRPRLLIDVFNLGSPRKPVLYDQKHYLTPDRTGVNSNYGAVTQYQPPTSARVGMVVDF